MSVQVNAHTAQQLPSPRNWRGADVWANSVIRRNVISQLANNQLAILARCSQMSFLEAVRQLYRNVSMESLTFARDLAKKRSPVSQPRAANPSPADIGRDINPILTR